MPAAKSKLTLALSPKLQLLFVAMTILIWASGVASIAFDFLATSYVGSETWLFQATLWAFPVALFIVSFWLVGHWGGPLKRLFVTCLATYVGLGLYTILQTWEQELQNRLFPDIVATNTNPGLWAAFGQSWLAMIAGFIVYTAALYVVVRKCKG